MNIKAMKLVEIDTLEGIINSVESGKIAAATGTLVV